MKHRWHRALNDLMRKALCCCLHVRDALLTTWCKQHSVLLLRCILASVAYCKSSYQSWWMDTLELHTVAACFPVVGIELLQRSIYQYRKLTSTIRSKLRS